MHKCITTLLFYLFCSALQLPTLAGPGYSESPAFFWEFVNREALNENSGVNNKNN